MKLDRRLNSLYVNLKNCQFIVIVNIRIGFIRGVVGWELLQSPTGVNIFSVIYKGGRKPVETNTIGD